MTNCRIQHSDKGEYYEMYVNDILVGTYDTVKEAAEDYDRMATDEKSA